MKRKLAHGIGAAFVMALLAAVFSMGASAQTLDHVMYLDENGDKQYAESATVVTPDLTEWTEDQTDGWYVVPKGETVSIYGNVAVEGTVNLILEPRSKLEINGDIIGNETASLKVYSQVNPQVNPNIDEWQDWLPTAVGSLYCYNSINLESLSLIGGCVDGNEFWFTELTVNGGYLNGMGQVHDIVCNNSFDISSGYAAGNLQCSKATVSGGTVEGKITSGKVEITGGTINSSEYVPYPGVVESTEDIKISGGEVNGNVHSSGNIEINSENSNPEINGRVESDGDIAISGGQVNGSVYANYDSYGIGTATITGGRVTDSVNGTMVHVTGGTLGSAYASEILNIQGDTVIDGDVSAGSRVNMYSGTIGGVYMLASDMGSLTVNITGGTVTEDVDGSVIYVGDQGGKTEPVIRGSIPNTRGSDEHRVTVYSGTVKGNIDTPFFTMEGGSVNSVECQRANIDGGKAESLSIESDGSISNGTIDTIWMYSAREDGLHGGILSIYGGTFLKHPITYKSVIMDYTGRAFGADYVPNDALYLYKEGEIWNGIAGGVAGGGNFDPPLEIEKGGELVVLPGATLAGRVRNNGTILVAGMIDDVTGTQPYYAINADAETVSGVSATGAIVQDGVTFAQPDALVTLTPKESGAVRWAVEPAALTVQNNKFYMPDEVVNIKASKLPLEDTPKLGIDSKGENLTGLTVGAYYSISDAIFRPSKTALPIRPEWYGTTVTIIKLGDGFATADSFAQSLSIPAKSGSGGTVTPTPTPGGDDSGWEQVEEEITDAKPGATVTVEDPDIPREILEALAGEDVTLRVKVNSSLSWEIKGGDLKISASYSDLDLAVTWKSQGIPADLLSPLLGRETVQFSVKHDGEFGFALTLTAPLGKENAGYWANLYHYDENTKTLNYETSAQIDDQGDASLRMTHASQYAIVIDEKSHELPFTDLGETQWYESAVRYAYTHDIMEGMSATKFSPNISLTRAQAVQVLYNLEGQPTVSGNAAFPDQVEEWYKPAIAWAESTGVVDGYEDGTFRPDQPVTRQEFAQMMYNYAAYKGYDLSAQGDLNSFPDGDSVQEWALPAMLWANGNALINGHDDGTLDPASTTTRVQAASILMRFDLNVAEN